MSIEELKAMATTMKTPNCTSNIREQLVYDIIDAQADEVRNDYEVAPKRRRISSYNQDHVYSANQSGSSERFDSAKDERAAKRMVAAKARETEAAVTQALLDADQIIEPPKRRRGRPTKAEVEERRQYEELLYKQAMARQQRIAQSLMAESMKEQPSPSSSPKAATPQSETATHTTAQIPLVHPDILVAGRTTNEEKTTTPTPTMAESPKAEEKATITAPGANDDLPDFILEQMAQQQAAPSVASTTETSTSNASEERHPALHNPLADVMKMDRQGSHILKPNLPILDKAPESDFVIVEDIPFVEETDFSFIPPTQDTSFYAAPDTQVPRFRKFKDDALVNPHLQQRNETTVASTATEFPTAPTAPVLQPTTVQPTQHDVIIDANGVLELTPQGTGFLRSSDYNYLPSPDDVFVAQHMVRNFALKMGDVVEGKVKVPRDGEKYYVLTSIERINGLEPHQVRDRIAFEHLTPLFPEEQFKLSKQGNAPLSCRIVDLFSPIGKGQRALIVAQPKTGKTILMKEIANAIAANYPDTYLMMLLIDERPEEVTDMARTVKAEVVASTFDEPATNHVRIAQMVLEKAKRMVECGHDVVIFLDSITRLARAFNTVAPTSGKILTGGVDANALQKPKRFFGAARNIEHGGSLTIIATALTDTGSKMDEVIFEEFKGTGNMELQLDRALSNKRIFPAVNLVQSSTRRDDLLLDPNTVNRMHVIRNFISDMNSTEAINFVQKRLKDSGSNEEFLMKVNK